MIAAWLMRGASCAALLLGGCVNPDFTANPAGAQPQSAADRTAVTGSARPAAAPSSQTLAGRKVQDLRGDMANLRTRSQAQLARHEQLRGSSQLNGAEYANLVADIRARLQAGSPPGNPRLLEQWSQAQAELDQLAQDTAAMMLLSAELVSTSSLAAYVVDSSRAALSLSGAVEEDHVALRALDSEASQSLFLIDRMLNELAPEASRQIAYVASERRNLQVLSLAIANGELYGESLANRTLASANGPAAAPLALQPAPVFSPLPPRFLAGQRPLVTIRFDQPNVDYAQALYQAISQALDRFPQARFELVAVNPTALTPGQTPLVATDTRRNAEGVYRTLLQLGLPGDRVRLFSAASPAARTGEVQIYLR